jgi:hypothetical protein
MVERHTQHQEDFMDATVPQRNFSGELLDQLEQPNLRENVSASPSTHF